MATDAFGNALASKVMQPILILVNQLLAEIKNCTESLNACEDTIANLLSNDGVIRRIDEVSGIGL